MRPGWHLTFAMLAALAAGGTVLSAIAPPAGAVLLLITAAAMYGDLAAGFHTLQAVHPPPDHPQRDVGRAARVAGRARDPDRPPRHRAHGPAVRDPVAAPGAPAAPGHVDEPSALPLLDGDGGAGGRDRRAGGGGLGPADGPSVRAHGDLPDLRRAAARRGRGRSLSGRRRQRLGRRGRARGQPPPGGRPPAAGGDAGRLQRRGRRGRARHAGVARGARRLAARRADVLREREGRRERAGLPRGRRGLRDPGPQRRAARAPVPSGRARSATSGASAPTRPWPRPGAMPRSRSPA